MQLGNAVAGDLIRGYATWRGEAGLAPPATATNELPPLPATPAPFNGTR
jgi:hypothetical protein